MSGVTRGVLRGAVAVVVVAALAGCGDRSDTETADEFVTAFNEGTLADHRYGLYERELSSGQLRTLTDLSERCSIDPDSVAVVDGFVSPHLKTFGAIADCDGSQYSVITGISRDCGAGPDCDGDFRIDPGALPGGTDSRRPENDALPQAIRALDPLESPPG